MSKTIAVGKALQELQSKIKMSYGPDYKIKVTEVVVEVSGPGVPRHEVFLRPPAEQEKKST